MLKKLHTTCDEATAICDKSQYGEASLLEKIKLNIHFIRCRFCFLYTKQNIALSKLYRGYAKICKDKKEHLTKEEKEEIKKNLERIHL